MSPGATFERVYRALRDQLGSGRFRAGEHLEPAALSIDLNASITPVRDALHRLVGEGLVEAPRGDGFRFPLVTEMGLRHLYRWNRALLDLGARASGARAPGVHRIAAAEGDTIDTAERLFLEIAGRSANPEHLAAVALLNARLRTVRRAELELLSDPAQELMGIADSLSDPAARDLRRRIAAYHRGRERLAAELVAALQPDR
ncbi:MAG TPA: GntR family transcriptional regulator [Allosphingosinicella sp.]|nr:GntR family transcriptional regulator [Allosphingosinicella sp.]